jgi:AcrR family transcriptional regulator
MTTTPGRRDQNKAATRSALHDAARRMFAEHGFERTTVRDIAAAAGVTERTFFRYFPAKEDLVLGEVLDLLPELHVQIVSRPAEEAPYRAVLGALLAVAEGRESGLAILFSGPPAHFLTRPRPGSVLIEFENGIAAALAERLSTTGVVPGQVSFRAAVLARASVSAMRSTLLAYAALPEHERSLARARELVVVAFTVLAQGA